MLPFISGDETYTQPTQEKTKVTVGEGTGGEGTKQVFVLPIPDYKNPQQEAEEYFRSNPDEESLIIKFDGSEKRFIKTESGTGRNKRISVQEVG